MRQSGKLRKYKPFRRINWVRLFADYPRFNKHSYLLECW